MQGILRMQKNEYYFYQRWYDPEVGKFVSKSPLPNHVEHPYSYTSNNPVNVIDVNGKKPFSITTVRIRGGLISRLFLLTPCAAAISGAEIGCAVYQANQ
jgi:RHS repeat-associated protein